MKHPDKIISHEDWCKLREHLKNFNVLSDKPLMVALEKKHYREENENCIKILEDCKNAQ